MTVAQAAAEARTGIWRRTGADSESHGRKGLHACSLTLDSLNRSARPGCRVCGLHAWRVPRRSVGVAACWAWAVACAPCGVCYPYQLRTRGCGAVTVSDGADDREKRETRPA